MFKAILIKIRTNKKSDFVEMLGHAKNYFGANIATKALGFISIPVLTRLLSVEDYGVLNTFSSYVSIFCVLLTANLYSAVGRFYYDKTIDLSVFLSTSVLLTFLAFFLNGTIFICTLFFFPNFFGLDKKIMVYILPFVLYNIFDSFFMQIFQAKKESKLIAKRQITIAYSSFIFSVFFILLLKSDKYMGQIYAQLTVYSAFMVYYFVILRKYITMKFSFEYVKAIFKYSIPLIPYFLSSIILTQIDRIMLNSFNGAAAAGLFSFAANIASLLTVFSSALYSAWIPFFYSNIRENNEKAISDNIDKMVMLNVLAALGLMLFGKELGMLLARKDFYSALGYLPIIVMGNLVYSLFPIYNWAIDYKKKTLYSTLIVFVGGMSNLCLNYVFIPRFGINAAVLDTLCSYFITVFVAWFIASRVLKCAFYSFRKVLFWLLFTSLFAGLTYFSLISIESFIVALLVKVAIFFVASGCVGIIAMYNWKAGSETSGA